jgi:hypothetical protein
MSFTLPRKLWPTVTLFIGPEKVPVTGQPDAKFYLSAVGVMSQQCPYAGKKDVNALYQLVCAFRSGSSFSPRQQQYIADRLGFTFELVAA